MMRGINMAKKKTKKVIVHAPGPNADAGNVIRSEPPKKGRNVYDAELLQEEPETDEPGVRF